MAGVGRSKYKAEGSRKRRRHTHTRLRTRSHVLAANACRRRRREETLYIELPPHGERGYHGQFCFPQFPVVTPLSRAQDDFFTQPTESVHRIHYIQNYTSTKKVRERGTFCLALKESTVLCSTMDSTKWLDTDKAS